MVFPGGKLGGRSPACAVAIGPWAVTCALAAYQRR